MSPDEIDRYRAYLIVLARQQVPGAQDARVDASGVVQQTLLDAHQADEVFAGLNSQQRLAWLRVALARNLTDAFRRLHADKRDVRREQAIAAGVESSASGLERWLAADLLSPSRQADRNEQLLRIAVVLAELPEAQRFALEQHYFERRPVAAIAADLGKTVVAVAGLLKRGLQTLRERLRDSEERADDQA
jgi:RNA polymerase sigma-70 factor (ECF subfamily)